MSTEVIDLRDFPFMPLHIERLRKSKAWLQCKRHPELAFYLFNLWMRSWHEIPAGSVEDDDDVLADAAMCSMPRWLKIRDQVLRNWEKKEDGRLYHTTVTEIAAASWQGKIKQRNRTAAARAAKLLLKPTEDVTTSVTDCVTGSVTENVTSSKGREGKGSKREKESEQDAAGAALKIDLERDLFDRGKVVLGKSSGGLISNLLKAKGSTELARAAIETAATKQNPREWIGACIRGDPDLADARERGDAW